MALELELDDQAEKLIRDKDFSRQNLCPKCNTILQGNVCPNCGETVDRVRERYSDPDFDEYVKKVEEESVDVSKLKWEDIKDTDLDKMEEELS